jgi:hypothetical protein
MTETVFEIGGQSYNVVKKGVAQATQVSHLGVWLGKYGTQAYRAVQNSPDSAGGIAIIGIILSQLDTDALIELYSLLFGCGIDVANEEFDIAVLIDGALALYENSPTIKKVMNRFFSSNRSTSTPIESSTQ